MVNTNNPGRYSIIVDEKEGTILDIKMDDNTSQKIISDFENDLIDAMMVDDESVCDDVER
jgi:hypothetical protein